MRLGVVHQKLLPNFYLRRDKRLIAHELPEKKDLVVFCPLAEKQILAYQRLIQSDGTLFRLILEAYPSLKDQISSSFCGVGRSAIVGPTYREF